MQKSQTYPLRKASIDALTGFDRSVGGFAKQGDTIVPTDKDGNELNVEKIIHKDDDGKPFLGARNSPTQMVRKSQPKMSSVLSKTNTATPKVTATSLVP